MSLDAFGYVIDKNTLQPLPNATVAVRDVWLTDEEQLRVELELPSEGAYYRRSLEVDTDGNYTIESNLNPVLQDGTILTKDNHEQYDGAEG